MSILINFDLTVKNFFVILIVDKNLEVKMIELDYSIQSPEERNELVKRYIEENGIGMDDKNKLEKLTN